MHVRTQIRDAVIGKITNLSLTGDRVFKPPMMLKASTEMPCLRVRCGDEQIGGLTITQVGIQQRSMVVFVDCFSQDKDDVEAHINEIAAEVEAALDGFPLSDSQGLALVQELTLSTFDAGLTNELETPTGMVTLGFRAEYFANAGDPSSAV